MNISTIIRKEWLVWKRNNLLMGLSAVFLVLSLYSGIIGRIHQEEVRESRELAETQVRKAWENQRDKNPHSAAHFGTYVFKPVSPLWFFDHGVDRFVGVSLFLEGHRQHDLQYKPIQDETALGRHIELTPAFFLTYLMPLLVILAAFGSISGERDQQTLSLVFSLVDRRFWIGAKWLASALLVTALISVSFLFQSVILMTSGGTWSDWGVLMAFAAVFMIYGLVFLTLTMLVSALSRSTSTAFTWLVMIWVLASFLIPRLISEWSEFRIPLPSAQEFKAALSRDLREGVDGHNPFSETSTRLLQETLSRFNVDKVEDLPFNWNGFIMQEGEKHESEVYQRHIHRLQALHEAQSDLHRSMAWLSPVGAMRLVSMDASQTGVRESYRFRSEAEQYRVRLVGELNSDLMNNFDYNDWDGTRSGDFFAQNERFRYAASDPNDVIKSILAPSFGLAAWLGILFVLLVAIVAKRSPL